MTLDLGAIVDAVNSHGAASGHFDQVAGHEPVGAPGNGLEMATWLENLGPVRQRSGLAATSARVELTVRITAPLTGDSATLDRVDPAIASAVDALMRAYGGDFTLGGQVAHVDLLGAYGAPLAARARYLEQDGVTYRAVLITLPLILDDLWAQEA